MPVTTKTPGKRTDLACTNCSETTRALSIRLSRSDVTDPEAGRTFDPIGRACPSCGWRELAPKPRKKPCTTHVETEVVYMRGPAPTYTRTAYARRCTRCHQVTMPTPVR